MPETELKGFEEPELWKVDDQDGPTAGLFEVTSSTRDVEDDIDDILGVDAIDEEDIRFQSENIKNTTTPNKP